MHNRILPPPSKSNALIAVSSGPSLLLFLSKLLQQIDRLWQRMSFSSGCELWQQARSGSS